MNSGKGAERSFIEETHPAEKKQAMFGGFVKADVEKKRDNDDGDMDETAYKAGYGDGTKKSGYMKGYKSGMDKGAYKAGYTKATDEYDEDQGSLKDDKEGRYSHIMHKAEDFAEGTISEERLLKSLEELECVSQQRPLTRREELLHKSEAGPLTDEECVELVDILSGGGELAAEIKKSMEPPSELKKSMLDVSEFLREIHGGLTSGLHAVADRLEKSTTHQHEYNAALAEGIVTIGRALQDTQDLVKSLRGAVDQISSQPARGPRAKLGRNHQPQPLAKSMGAPEISSGPEEQDRLSKSQVLDALEEMLVKSDQGQYGPGGGYSKSGEDIHAAIAKYESQNLISQGLAGEVLGYRRSQLN